MVGGLARDKITRGQEDKTDARARRGRKLRIGNEGRSICFWVDN